MITRPHLKTLYSQREILYKTITETTEQYIKELDGDIGIFVSDHAIVRYVERVLNYNFHDDGLTDQEKIQQMPYNVKYIREGMLSVEQSYEILRSYKTYYPTKDNIVYVVKELAIVSVILN